MTFPSNSNPVLRCGWFGSSSRSYSTNSDWFYSAFEILYAKIIVINTLDYLFTVKKTITIKTNSNILE